MAFISSFPRPKHPQCRLLPILEAIHAGVVWGLEMRLSDIVLTYFTWEALGVMHKVRHLMHGFRSRAEH